MKAVFATFLLIFATVAISITISNWDFKPPEYEHKALRFEVSARNVSNLQRVTITNIGDDLKLKDVVVIVSTSKNTLTLKGLPVKAVGIPKTHGVGGVFSKKGDLWKFGQYGYFNLAKCSFGVLKKGDKVWVRVRYKNLEWKSSVTFDNT